MDDLADKQIRTARALFNLAHRYLRTTNIDDEQEDKIYEDNEKHEKIKKDIQQTEKEEVNRKQNYVSDKKEEKKCELDNEIELYLQIQVDSKLQQQLCTDIQNKKDLKKQNPEIQIELKIEIPQEFDSLYLKNSDKEKQNFEEKIEKQSKKIHELNQKNKSGNEQELTFTEINADSEFQHGTKRGIILKQNISKNNVDLNKKNINSLTTQNQIKKGNEIKLQEKDNSDLILETELPEQKNINENMMKSSSKSDQEMIKELILREQQMDRKLTQKIEDLNNDIKEINPENLNELNKYILEKYSKKDLAFKIKFFKKLYCSFIQDLTPFYNRLDQLSNDKTQSTVQKKLNEEFVKKLDSLLQPKCNEKIQEGINKDEIIQNQFEEINRKEKYQHYDLVIQYNHEMSQVLKGHEQQVVGKNVLVDYYDDAVKTFIDKFDKDALNEKLCNAGTDVIDQIQKKGNKDIKFQIEFYKNGQVEEELQKKNGEQLQNNAREESNDDLILKTKENETEVQKDSDLEIDDSKEEIRVYSEIKNDENVEKVHKNSKFIIEALERAIEVESGVKIEESEKEEQDNSDVDIEGFEGEILEFPEVKIEDFEEEEQDDSDVDIEGFEGEILEFPEVKIEDFVEESQESTDSDTKDLSEEEFNDKNEVIEIVEDVEVESNCSIDDHIPSDKISTPMCDELNLKIDPNSKLAHDDEEKLTTINSNGHTIYTDHIKQNQTFFELQHQLDELSQEYKGYVQQKVFKNLQQEIDDKQLQEMEICPDKFNEANVNTEKKFQKEIDELQNEWCQLKPEFMSEVPLSFDEDNSSKKLKEKPFNLFEKLYSIHRKLLCKFADSKEWPENCFQPSSLLDVLFDDPNEFKPNVLVVILHSLDKGYSIKINMERNSKSPKEYFFNYHDDTILKYIEEERLPPELLDTFEKAEPKLFYCGCVIAEIHDEVDEVPGRVYRLLLRPFSLSIRRDIASIIAKNSDPIDEKYWSYTKRLMLESMLLTRLYPYMCMDSSPIAGLVVNLQHQVLSCRTKVLNPLKRKSFYSVLKSLKTNLCNKSNDHLNTSMLSNEPQEGYSNLMDTENTNNENIVFGEFDFCLKSLIPFKMFVLYITEIHEYSMILYTNSMVASSKMIRFKIEQHLLDEYVKIIQDIFQQRISPDIEVVQKYTHINNSAPISFGIIPSLLNDKIYKASHEDLMQIIDMFINNSHIKYLPLIMKVGNMYTYNSEMTKFETEKKDLSLIMEKKLATDTLNTHETKENSKNPEIKKSMQFCETKKLSTNSKKFLNVLKIDLKDEIPDASPLKTLSIPQDTIFDEDSFPDPSFILENDNSSDLVNEEISVSSSSMIPKVRFLTTTIPFDTSPAVVLSSLSTVNTLVTSIKTYMLPIETPSLGYIAKSESLSLPTGKNLSTSTFNDDDDDIYTNVETLPVIQPDDLIYLTKIANAVNMFSKSECIESRELLEDQYMLRCLQLFHRQPTLPDISIPPNTQVNTHPELGFPDDSFADCALLSDINTVVEIFPTHNLENEDEVSDNT